MYEAPSVSKVLEELCEIMSTNRDEKNGEEHSIFQNKNTREH